jgi:hypothetical protein
MDRITTYLCDSFLRFDSDLNLVLAMGDEFERLPVTLANLPIRYPSSAHLRWLAQDRIKPFHSQRGSEGFLALFIKIS